MSIPVPVVSAVFAVVLCPELSLNDLPPIFSYYGTFEDFIYYFYY